MKLFYQIFVLQLLALCAISCSTESGSSSADVIPESGQNIANQETVRIPPGDNITEVFSFVQLCDTQLGMTNFNKELRTFKNVVNQINDSDAEFVVICGDLIHNGIENRYTEFNIIKKSLNVPCYVAPGNHDLGMEVNSERLDFYRSTVEDDYYSFEKNGMAFIVTNTQFWKTDWGEQSNIHNEWFEITLKEYHNSGYPSIVIGHYPLFNDHALEVENSANLPLNLRSKLLGLFKNNNVKAYLSGHNHKYQERDFKGIITMSGESINKNFDNSPVGYRLWEVSKNTLKHQFVAVAQ